ncbi:uncharacterized protein LOC144762684 [Lissotriton helveticus]
MKLSRIQRHTSTQRPQVKKLTVLTPGGEVLIVGEGQKQSPMQAHHWYQLKERQSVQSTYGKLNRGIDKREKQKRVKAMESFCFCDIGFMVHRKSIEHIISPMVSQFCELIISTEREDLMDSGETMVDLTQAAEGLARATEEFAILAKRWAENSEDDSLRQEMDPVADSILVSGKNILLAAQKFHIQPDVHSHKEELIGAAQMILGNTLKILMIEDNADMRRIVQAAQWLLDCLAALESAASMLALLTSFQDFSEAILLLNNLTEKWIIDLKDQGLRKNLSTSLQTLKKCIPMLHTATQSCLKHPHNKEVSSAKFYIVDLTEKTTQGLISLLNTSLSSENRFEGQNSFSQQFNQLLALLSDPTPANLSNGSLEFLVGTHIYYCMFVAAASKQELKQKLLRHCCAVSELRRRITSQVSARGVLPVWKLLEPSLHQHCGAMRAELEAMNETLVSSMLNQILDTFTYAKEHLKRLIESALEVTVVDVSPIMEGDCLKNLQPLIVAFHNHTDHLLRVVSIVLAWCTNSKTADDIENSMGHLKLIRASIVPLLAEVCDSSNRPESLEKLQTLYQTWTRMIESLLASFDDFFNVQEFLGICVHRIQQGREQCERTLESEKPEQFLQYGDDLCAQANHIVQLVSRYVEKKQDPIFRNGLLALIKQIEQSIEQARKAKSCCQENPYDVTARTLFLEKIQHVTDSVYSVRSGLDGSNHPDILSPLREHVRSQPKRWEFPELRMLPLSQIDSNKQEQAGDNQFLEYLSKALPPADCLCKETSLVRSSTPENLFLNYSLMPVIREVMAAAKKNDIEAVHSASSDLFEFSNIYIDAANEALPIAHLQDSCKLRKYAGIQKQTSRIIYLCREGAVNPAINMDQLVKIAILLSDELVDMKKSLVMVAGIWGEFSQKLICTKPNADFPSRIQIFKEANQKLSAVVCQAGDMFPMDFNKKINKFPMIHETFLEIQTKLARLETSAKYVLETAMSYQDDPWCTGRIDLLEAQCILWSVGVQRLLKYLDKFTGEDIQPTIGSKQKWLASILECSIRIQETAKMSTQCCIDQTMKLRINQLRKQIEHLTEDLLQTAEDCEMSPVSSIHPVRMELLQRQIFLNVKALMTMLQSTNKEYAGALQGIVNLVSARATAHGIDKENNFKAFDKRAHQINENIQRAKIGLKQAFGNFTDLKSQESFISMADHLTLLLSDFLGRARKMLSGNHQDGTDMLRNIVSDWSARAHFLVTQLEAVEGIEEGCLDFIKQCLQKSEAPTVLKTAEVSLSHTEYQAAKKEVIKKGKKTEETSNSPVISGKDRLKIKSERHKCYDDPRDVLKSSGTELPNEDQAVSVKDEAETEHIAWHPIVQVTKEMDKQMSYLVQYLTKEGPIQTKDQLIASTRQIASSGQTFAKFAQVIAKNCVDKRCSAELSSVVQQIHTISNQLSIISSVKAATSSENSTDEVLVKNAENLIHTILRTLKAAEAACVRGLKPLSSEADKNEIEIAAFCRHWKKTIQKHRETLEDGRSETDELGLRKVNHTRMPTLISMMQVPLSPQ